LISDAGFQYNPGQTVPKESNTCFDLLRTIFYMLTKEEKISSLNKELYRTIKYTNKYSSSSSHDQKALELAQVIYSHSPSTFAYQCRVIALIRLGQFNKAIDLLDQHSTSDDGLLYEKAYCYYRTLQLEKALELLDQLRKHAQYWQQNKLAICHLQAQIVCILYLSSCNERAY
jgi:tetratricopeptide (TPR) repeat protein